MMNMWLSVDPQIIPPKELVGINGIILDVDAIKFRGFHALMDGLVDPHQSIIQHPIAATIYVE
jgi:hypothetical protein